MSDTISRPAAEDAAQTSDSTRVASTSDSAGTAQPATGEDGKAAAALSALDDRTDNNETPNSASSSKMTVLGDAMAKLEKPDDGEKVKVRTKFQIDAEKRREEKAEEERRIKAVKVDAADVTLLVEQLDVSKAKATDLLKRHGADAVKAMSAWVTTVG